MGKLTPSNERMEELKAEVRIRASGLERKIKIAERERTEAYNLPWGLGHASVETSRDRADDHLFDAEREAILYGKSIRTTYSHLGVSQREELVETYLEVVGRYLSGDQVSEIRKL